MSQPVFDPVSDQEPCAQEIGFAVPSRYNASEILFHNLVAGRDGKTAVYAAAGSVTYAALCARANRYAAALTALGLAKGARVPLLLNDTADYPAAFFGAVRAGFVPVLLNTVSPPDLLRFYIEDAGAEAAITHREHVPVFTAAGAALRRLIVAEDDAAWLASFPGDFTPARTHRDDMAFWMYSSGSTGKPKGIVHLHHDMAYTAASYGAHVLQMKADDICFSVPKIFFAYGFGNSLTFPFSVGASSVLHPGRPEPQAVFDCVRTFRPTVFFGLPTLYNALLGHPDMERAGFSSVRLCVSAAEPLSHDLFHAWKARTGHEIVEGLGSTEVLHIYLSNTPRHKKLGTAGRRVPGYEIQLTTPEGEPVPRGEPGVMRVRGGSNAPFYWNRPEKTAQTMQEGWIWTGDRLVEDTDGFFTYAGRVDDLIKVSGQWVWPQEIELALFEHPTVKECAVLGMERSDRRMTLKAFVVPEADATPDEALKETLRQYVKSKLLPFKYPRYIEFLPELPKTGTGKIDRQTLKETGL